MNTGFLHRAHPYTVPTLTLAVALLALLLPNPAGPLGLFCGTALLAASGGTGRAVLRALAVAAPLWFFLLVILAVQGDPGHDPFNLAGVLVSRAGLRAAIGQGARLSAIITMTLVLVDTLRPHRLLDAVSAHGGRTRYLVAYVTLATLDTVRRFRDRARGILAAQRVRGLRTSGSPLVRLKALAPVAGPLLLGGLIEVDDRAIAAETREATTALRRTPLHPPVDTKLDRISRRSALLFVLAALLWRLFR